MNTLQTELARIFGSETIPAPTRRVKATEYPPGYASHSPREQTARDEHEQRPMRPTRRVPGAWAQHSVDMDSFYHGKRKAKRGDARTPWAGMAVEIKRTLLPEQFIRGKGLSRDPRNRFTLYVEGKVRGYHNDINYALAWAKAAGEWWTDARCYEEERS